MKNSLFAFLVLLGLAPQAFSMPCDTGYLCKSASGKIEIKLQHCRYTNYLRLESLKMNNRTVANAELGAYWDGKSVGEKLLAFEITLPSEEGSLKVLSVEVPKNTLKGVAKVKYAAAEPEPMKTLRAEAISCQDDQ